MFEKYIIFNIKVFNIIAPLHHIYKIGLKLLSIVKFETNCLDKVAGIDKQLKQIEKIYGECRASGKA